LLMDDFGTGPTAAGLVLAGFGLAGIATAAWWGRWVARRGPALTGAVGMLGGGLLVLVLPQMPGPVGVAVVWAVVGSLSTLATVALQNLALRETPGNPGGTVSVVSSFRFGGAALA